MIKQKTLIILCFIPFLNLVIVSFCIIFNLIKAKVSLMYWLLPAMLCGFVAFPMLYGVLVVVDDISSSVLSTIISAVSFSIVLTLFCLVNVYFHRRNLKKFLNKLDFQSFSGVKKQGYEDN